LETAPLYLLPTSFHLTHLCNPGQKTKNNNNKKKPQWLNACNPSYSGGRDQEDLGSKPVQASSSQDPIWKTSQKRAGGAAQLVRALFSKHEFKPQCCEKKGLILWFGLCFWLSGLRLIPATVEVEFGRIAVRDQPRQKVTETTISMKKLGVVLPVCHPLPTG
jgi:hypothetical protein